MRVSAPGNRPKIPGITHGHEFEVSPGRMTVLFSCHTQLSRGRFKVEKELDLPGVCIFPRERESEGSRG